MVTNARENTVTYCMSCGGTIYWDHEGDPVLVKCGDHNLLTCLAVGCSLISIQGGEAFTNFELFRRRLIDAGIPADTAMSIAALLCTHYAGAAAA
ncbi:MAG TPA: hypothetical protein VLR94_07235 [Acidobacteriota bacterium]|nr:hypothetical protein [Acidobacteriota bacterium]